MRRSTQSWTVIAVVTCLAACSTAPRETPDPPRAPAPPLRRAEDKLTAEQVAETAALVDDVAVLVMFARQPWTGMTWPLRSDATCRHFNEREHGRRDEDSWCIECTLSRGAARATYRFHRKLEAGPCTLQEVQIESTTSVPGIPESLEAVIEPLLGRAESVDLSTVDERISSQWLEVLEWSTESDLAYAWYEHGAP